MVITDHSGDLFDGELGTQQQLGRSIEARIPEKMIESRAHLKPE